MPLDPAQAAPMLEHAVEELAAGRFQSADGLLQNLLEGIDGPIACCALQAKVFLRLAQGRMAESRNITAFLAYSFKDDAISDGWRFLMNKLESWPFLPILLKEYSRALASYPPIDDLWRRVTVSLPGVP
ncbi:hypothetical protein MTBLM1_80178 [Rhodospirillaceae bacterium LM-1]|nr:hypothetical protein MTBLM1_80178 [Rhodospirillaceae bacterium LM-1]